MKIRPAGAQLFRTDRQTDLKRLIITFRNFANTSINRPELLVCVQTQFVPRSKHTPSICYTKQSVTLHTWLFLRHLHVCCSLNGTMQIFPNKSQLCYQRSSYTFRNCRCGSHVWTADCWPEVSVHPTETSRLRCQKKKWETCTNLAGSEPPLLRKVIPSSLEKAFNIALSYGSPSNCATCTVIVMWQHTTIMEVWNDVLKGANFRTSGRVTMRTARHVAVHAGSHHSDQHPHSLQVWGCQSIGRKQATVSCWSYISLDSAVLSTVHAHTARLLHCQNYSIFSPPLHSAFCMTVKAPWADGAVPAGWATQSWILQTWNTKALTYLLHGAESFLRS